MAQRTPRLSLVRHVALHVRSYPARAIAALRRRSFPRFTCLVPLLLLVLLLGAILYGWHYFTRPKDPYEAKARSLARPYLFSIPKWEREALVSEFTERVGTSPPPYDSPLARQMVLDYLELARRIGSIESQIERLAAEDDGTGSVQGRIRALQVEVDRLRAEKEPQRPVVERVLEQQITAILRQENLGWGGFPLPPVAFQFAEPPYYLILSPRDRIELRLGLHLKPQLSLTTRVALEERAEQELPNTSALVEGIGGFSTWPTMVIDRADIRWILSTIAHEWTHTYLIAYPLGRHYYDSPDVAAINETVADIVGSEVGTKALRHFYPELAPPEPTPTPVPSQVKPLPTPVPTPTPVFDFVREMRITRETVDKLLAEGKVEEAERYMEERRRFFVAHGYYIRKLNQAYFAFHGTYRTGPAAPAEDPIAPRLRKLRRETGSLAAFLHEVRGMKSLEDLLRRVPEP